MGLTFIVTCVFATGLLGVSAIALAWRDLRGSQTETEDRLDQFAQPTRPAAPPTDLLVRDPLEDDRPWYARCLARLPLPPGLTKLTEQADVPIEPAPLLALCGVLALLGAGVAMFMPRGALAAPVAAGVLGSLPYLWLCHRRRQRMKKFAGQLPDALELVARALRAGHPLNVGMNVVAEEMPAPVANEFARVVEEQGVGITTDDALRGMADRAPNIDLRFFVTAVLIQRQTGGDLAEILDKISYVIRERFKIYGQVQALTAEGRLSGIVLMALPLILFGVVYYINPRYVEMLFNERMGRMMLGGALVLQVIGALVIRKIVNIRV